jgi:hypothetical protein
MEFGFRHSALQAQQQPVVKGRWIVEPIFIQDEGPRHGAHFQQVMPIERTAREPGDFQAHHQSDTTKSHFRDQALKSLTVSGGSS